MHPRRLLRHSKRPADSFDASIQPEPPASNLLNKIRNQKLLMKLIGISLQLSEDAGLPREQLLALQSKLLAAKGLQQFSSLSGEQKNPLSTNRGVLKHKYDEGRKYNHPEELESFIHTMQRQVEDSQARQHIVFALKKYVANKKKTMKVDFIRREAATRGQHFKNRIQATRMQKQIQAKNCESLSLRQIMGRVIEDSSQSYQIMRQYAFLMSLMGHSFFKQAEEDYCPVFNVIFDNSGKLIITAGEDGLIKIWAKQNGALLTTLIGHTDFINKICITQNNKYILSSGADGVRFYDLQSMSSMGGYDTRDIIDIGQIVCQNEENKIIFANFEHLFLADHRTILEHRNKKLQIHDFKIFNFATHVKSVDGQNVNALLINPQNKIFLGFISGEILIVSFQKLKDAQQSGKILGNQVKVPQFILPVDHILKAHEGDIVQIKWNPILSYFCTGSKKDGSCKIWQMKNEQTQCPAVLKQLKIPKLKVRRKKRTFACNFVCWNCTYTHMACSYIQEDVPQEQQSRGDGDVLIYNATRGEVTWQMGRTIDLASIKCMDSHPSFPNVILVCDNNGQILLADIYQNIILNIFEERAYHLMHPQFRLTPSECRFSQDGLSFVVATEYGNVSLYGYDLNDFYHIFPTQQFYEVESQGFQLDPSTLKPVLDIDNPTDINQCPRGNLQNIRGQSYSKLPYINPFDVFENIFKQKRKEHLNSFCISQQRLHRMVENYLEHDRNFQLMKKNLQDLQNKRLAILYDEQQSRLKSFHQILQEKINLIKANENLSINNNPIAVTSPGIVPVNTMERSYRNRINQANNIGTRRRGRQSTRAVRNRPNNLIDPVIEESDEQFQDEEANQDSYSASVDPQNQNQSFQADQQEEDGDDFEENSSEQIGFTRRNRDRRSRTIPERRITNTRRYDNGRTRKRNPGEDIEALMNDFENFSRIQKRVKRDDDDDAPASYNQLDNSSRQIVRRSQLIDNQQRQMCSQCQNESKVSCGYCKQRRYCEYCKGSRGKRFGQKHFACFDCIYRNNQSPELRRNISQVNYIMEERNDFMFIPQIGDQVIYFFQGYQQFLADKIQVLNNRFLYEDKGMDDVLPHLLDPTLESPRKLSVVDIQYAFPLEESSNLTYQYKRGARGRMPSRNSSSDAQMYIKLKDQQGQQFWVYYLPGYQFLVKWQVYQDIIIKQRYNKFNLFDMATIKDESVQIMEIKPLSPRYPSSIWKNIIVHKGETKNLRHKDKSQDIAVNIWNISGFVDPLAFKDVPSMSRICANQYEQQINKIQQNYPQIWEFFSQFVDTELFPSYNQFVQVGICLSLIKKRLKNSYYHSEASFIRDINLIVENAIKFNGEQSYVTDLSHKLSSLILQGEDSQPVNNKQQTPIQSTQKKGSKKKIPNSSPQQSEVPSQKRKRPKISSFNEQESEQKIQTRNHRRKKIGSSSDENDEGGFESQEYSDMKKSSRLSLRPRTRNADNTMIKNQYENTESHPARMTRSRNKNI